MTMYVTPTDQQQPDDRAIAAAALAERSRELRTKRKFVTQMTPWAPGLPSVPFDVIIENLSESGVGVIHDHELPLGVPHLLTVPRGDQGRSIMREYVVLHCKPRSDGKFLIELAPAMPRETVRPPEKLVCSKNVKLLFLALGVAGLLAATFLP